MSPAVRISSTVASADLTNGAPSAPISSAPKTIEKLPVSIVDFEFSDDAKGSCVGRIFYPSSTTKKSTPPRWMPFRYTHAHARFMSRLEEGADRPLQKLKVAVGSAIFHSVLVANDARVPADAGVAAEPLKRKSPAVVFSHGMGGSRVSYSAFASALASEGLFVVAVEHTDSTAALARLPSNEGWRYYEPWEGFGVVGDEETARRSYVRREELASAVKVLKALAARDGTIRGLSLEGGKLPLDFFDGAIDAERVCACGHSFGGAAVVDAAAGGDDLFSSVVALCPWYPALAGGHANRAFTSDEGKARRRSPLLIIGSDAFNTPNEVGKLECDGEMQDKVLSSFSSSSSGSKNGGALFTIIKGSSHAGFTDMFSLPGLDKWREDQSSTGGGGYSRGSGEEEEGVVTERKQAASTVRASAEMTAAFLRSLSSKKEATAAVDERDRQAVEQAARRIGVGLRGVRVV